MYTICVFPRNKKTAGKGGAQGLSVLKVDTIEVKDISFIGKQVCAMLTTSAYAPILIKRIVIEGSAITHLEKFNLFPLTLIEGEGSLG